MAIKVKMLAFTTPNTYCTKTPSYCNKTRKSSNRHKGQK